MEEIKEELYYVCVFQDVNGKFHTSYPATKENYLSMLEPYTSKGWKIVHMTTFTLPMKPGRKFVIDLGFFKEGGESKEFYSF